MSFAVPNERPEPMSGVTVSVPAGVRIVRASDGGLEGDARRLDRDMAGRPARASDRRDVPARRRRVGTSRTGNAEDARAVSKRHDGRMAATLTVVPGSQDEESESVGWGWIAAIVGVGLIFIAGLAILAWRRKAKSDGA